MKTLKQYIDEKYAGNVTACARANGVKRQTIESLLKAKSVSYIIGGRRYQDKGEFK